MAINSNIALSIRQPQFDSPLNNLAQMLQLQGAQQTNALNTMKMDEYRAGAQEKNALRDLYAQPGFDPSTPDGLQRVMRVSPTQGLAMQKGILEVQKTRGDMAKTDAETQSKLFGLAESRYKAWQTTMGALAQHPNLSKDLALQTGQRLVQMGVMTPEMFEGAASRLSDDPQQLRQEILTGLKTQMTTEQMFTVFAPKVSTVDNGQQISRVDDNPNSPTFGQRIGAAPIQKLASPEAVMTDNRTRSEGAANRAQSDRHFNVTQGNAGNTYDAERGVVVNTRTQTATPVMQGGQPLPPKDKPMTEGQAKANLFGSRAKAADEIINKLAQSGVEQPGVIKRVAGSVPLVGDGLATVTNFTQSDQQQQVEQAQRDFINAVLRRESGAVIGADEFANAKQQYFPQPNDKPGNIKQKAQARQRAIEGILAEVPQNRAQPQRNVTVDW